jgi:hypothetical protein
MTTMTLFNIAIKASADMTESAEYMRRYLLGVPGFTSLPRYMLLVEWYAIANADYLEGVAQIAANDEAVRIAIMQEPVDIAMMQEPVDTYMPTVVANCTRMLKNSLAGDVEVARMIIADPANHESEMNTAIRNRPKSAV